MRNETARGPRYSPGGGRQSGRRRSSRGHRGRRRGGASGNRGGWQRGDGALQISKISSPLLGLYVAADDLADIGVVALLDEGGIAETLVVKFDIIKRLDKQRLRWP
jgi:hypothetical protein